MTAYSEFAATLQQHCRKREMALPIMDEQCHSQFLLHPSPTAKVCLFFHGFTSTPAQFVPIGETFFAAGYNVLIPLMPGHGIAGDWTSNNPPPLPEDIQVYQEFGQTWLHHARHFGERIVIGGLSGGSTLCLWLALEHANILDRALLFSPYLNNSNVIVDWVVQILDIYFEWRTEPGTTGFGYPGFLMPALRVFLNWGKSLYERIETERAAPSFVISSEKDAAVSTHDMQQIFAALHRHQPQTWFHCFDQQFDIQHNMMTRAEGNECVDLVLAIARAFVTSDLTWQEVQAIGDRMALGQTFEQAVATLNLGDRTSADLQTLLTLPLGGIKS